RSPCNDSRSVASCQDSGPVRRGPPPHGRPDRSAEPGRAAKRRRSGRGGASMVLGPDPSSPATVLIGEELVDTPGTSPASSPGKAIQGRSLGKIAWTRLKRGRVAIAGGVVVILLIMVAIFAPVIVGVLGHPPNEFHQDSELLDPALGNLPRGTFGGMSRDYLFGLEPLNGRDLFSRVVYGARISVLIAFVAPLLSVGIGTVLGVIAGYFGGWVDTLIARAMDVFLAF